jgi:hypothetical protein
METGGRMVVSRAGGRGDRELFKGYILSVLQDEKVLEICFTTM